MKQFFSNWPRLIKANPNNKAEDMIEIWNVWNARKSNNWQYLQLKMIKPDFCVVFNRNYAEIE